MLRSLVWLELCATWWWWLLVLLPFAIARQFNPHMDVPGASALGEVYQLELLWLPVVAAGLGFASGMRDRHGNRQALVRHASPGYILIAKALVPGILMPFYFAIGMGISFGVAGLPTLIASLWIWRPLEDSPAMVAPMFLAGLAAGLRQARWWATRFAPIAAVVTAITLAGGLAPWWWSYEWNRSLDWQGAAMGAIEIACAGFLCPVAAWWCIAALKAAQGEDGPGSRAAAASAVFLALLGVAMAPWLIISERWEGMRYSRIANRPGEGHGTYLVTAMPPLSLAGLTRASATWNDAYTFREYLIGGPFPGIHFELSSGTFRVYDKDHPGHDLPAAVPVLIQGAGALDGPTTLNEAWARLHLAYCQSIENRWRNLRVAGGFSGGRLLQAGDRAQGIRGGQDGDGDYWVMQDDHCSVRPHQGQGGPCRIFQMDTWSGPVPILRPLTDADPPFLGLWKDLRVGVWADHVSWSDGRHPEVQIPHPFTADMDGHIEIRSGEWAEKQPATAVYHWRPTPLSASRWHETVIDKDGTILAQAELPTAEGHPLFRALGIAGSPAIAAIGMALNRLHDEQTNRPWGSPVVLPWTGAGAMLAAAWTWWLLARRGVARRARWGWSAMALLGGVAVPLAALAVWHPAPRRACPACGSRRWADDACCPACGAAWGRPAADGRELCDAGPVLRETA